MMDVSIIFIARLSCYFMIKHVVAVDIKFLMHQSFNGCKRLVRRLPQQQTDYDGIWSDNVTHKFTLIVIVMVVGCTGSTASPTAFPSPAATIAEPTRIESTPTKAPATEEPTLNQTPEDTQTPENTQTPKDNPTPQNTLPPSEYTIQEYPVPAGSHPHDVAPAPDGTVWYTAQNAGALGRLDPASGETHHVSLGVGSAPHGVIVGPDGAAWVTDSGLNAIVRVDPQTEAVQRFPLPAGTGNANLNTAAFDVNNVLWFTGQNGIYGSLDPATGSVQVYDAPRGPGPYGITSTPDGAVYYASLANSYVGRIDPQSVEATILEPPTAAQGARRVWADSQGRWVREWNAGQVALYDPANNTWQEWKLPGSNPQAYAVYVDDQDMIWLSDFSSNSLVRFDPELEEFNVYRLPSPNAAVRQILGRSGEVWGAESGADKLVVIRTRAP
jgi:virginiamycin B lyase